MEKRCRDLSIFEFQKIYLTDREWYNYLAHMKWNGGFGCIHPSNPLDLARK